MRNSNCNYYYYGRPPTHPFLPSFYLNTCTFVQVVRTIYSFIHSFMHWENLIPYCRKHFSFILLAFLLYPIQYALQWLSSFKRYIFWWCLLLLLLSLGCVAYLSLSLILCVKLISIIFQVMLLRVVSYATRNRNWCTFRVDCLTKWYGVRKCRSICIYNE